MSKLTDFNVLSFDCFGTIIDWEAGVHAALQSFLDATPGAPSFSKKQLLDAYHECEAPRQAEAPGLPYDQLVAGILPQLAAKLSLPAPSETQIAAFGASVGDWPAFPDSVEALRRLSKHFKLVILSNVDRASFARTNAGPLQGLPFDLIITAQDVGSYKPDLRNFEYMLREVKEKFGAEKAQVLQTAQSQFHDHHPAKKMGMSSCWIVRPGAIMGYRVEEIYDWKFDTLGAMADAVESEGK
jgi:2-haloalkanoic acid dehalogenase type II